MGLDDAAAAAATSDYPSVLELLRDLVRTPSRGGIDDYGPVVRIVESWLCNAKLAPRVLNGPASPLAVVCDVASGSPGPDTIVVGGRGLLRVKITVFGQADHSASRRGKVANAVVKASRLVDALRVDDLGEVNDRFGLPPKLTVTSIRGGDPGSYSVVPDRCELEVDIRLTPSFDVDAAWSMLTSALAGLDRTSPAPRRSTVERTSDPWPPFQLDSDHPLPAALRAAALGSGFDPVMVVAGPSNIGNLLATHGIPATAGFGVRYRALHGTDESIDLATVAPVQATYHRALLSLLRSTE
ncbi:MAG: peptidase dimerization domain-containing protein [Actinobacteria bacterium]|nr:peptidase dimerization domain-containing protein [Actinomycetota bacterium]MBI3686631.1 peptidase dimerization domain-containing protein [Actinomycetota bacterium]